MIKVKHLRVDFGEKNVLFDLNLEIRFGQILGLVGPPDAGKSTLLKTMAGLVAPSEGELIVNNFDLEVEPEQAASQIAYLESGLTPLYENLKVNEFLNLIGSAYGFSKAFRMKKALELVEQLHFTDKWLSFIHQLSDSEKRKLSLATVILQDANVLLLDDIFTGLDEDTKVLFKAILKPLNNTDKIVIVSSESMADLMDISSSVGILDHGHLLLTCSMQQLKSTYVAKTELYIRLSEPNVETIKKLHQYLRNSKFIKNIKPFKSGEFRSQFSGSSQDASWLLTQLAKFDLPILEFNIREPNINTIQKEIIEKDKGKVHEKQST